MKPAALITTILVITIGLVDLGFVVFGDGTSTTVSQFLINIGFKAPLVVFMVGFVCGHVFGWMKPEYKP